MSFILAPSAKIAQELLSRGDILLTVEAEYGDFVAEGSVFTAAHHQPAGTKFAGTHVGGSCPSPCNNESIPFVDGVVLVSHLDLDTFGGCLRTIPGFSDLFFKKHKTFWELAEFVDVRGPHKLSESGASVSDLEKLRAFWAWSKRTLGRFPKDVPSDVTEYVLGAGHVLRLILQGDEVMLQDGRNLHAAEEDLNKRTFHQQRGDVAVRIATLREDFANHLYVSPTGVVSKAVACLNKASGSITISLADPVPGVSCRDIVQELWGPEAGGHEGIAGSPRERAMDEVDLEFVLWSLLAALERTS